MRVMTWWPARIAIAFLLVGGSARSASAQDWRQKHSPEDLLALGTAAYQSLPAAPSPANARAFLEALANLHAYAEVSPRLRTDRPHATEIYGALAWLSSNLGNVLPAGAGGKADDKAGLPMIERRGLAAYDSVRNRRASLASPFRSYVAAVTNLYVVRQAAPSASRQSLGALGWLAENPVGIVAGTSGKTDERGDNSLPRGRKPPVLGAARGTASDARVPDRAGGGVVRDHRGVVVRDHRDAVRDHRRVPQLTPTPAVPDLSGRWSGDDGGSYYVRQSGVRVWWLGESADGGRSWSNVFHGTLNPTTRTIAGLWIDVPKGAAQSEGELILRYDDEMRTLSAAQRTGGFRGSLWRR